MSAGPLRKCPRCGKLKLTRLIGAGAGVIFKGSGFYETDYKRAGAGAGSKAGGDGQSDSKAAEKPESKGTDSESREASKS
jgi:predicted nucleic acid-binding Zn ribbon protein